MLELLTDFSTSRWGKWTVIAVWLLLAAAIVPLAPGLADVVENNSSSFVPEGAESTRVSELIEERFPSNGTLAILVYYSEDGLSDAERAEAQELGEWLRSDEAPENVDRRGIVSIFTTPQAADGLGSVCIRMVTLRDGTTTRTDGRTMGPAGAAVTAPEASNG